MPPRDIVGRGPELLEASGFGPAALGPGLDGDGPCWPGQPTPSAPTSPSGERRD